MTQPLYWHKACAHLRRDPVLARLIDSHGDEALVSKGDAFATLLRSITGQQISVQAAANIMQRLEQLLGNTNPAQLLAQSDSALRNCGLSHQKIRYCRAVAEFCLRPPAWHATDPEKLREQLVALPGIGAWTWQMFAIFYLQLPDEFPLRDLGLRKALVIHYGLAGEKEIYAPEMQERIEGWRPWRSVVTWHLWRSLDPVPVCY